MRTLELLKAFSEKEIKDLDELVEAKPRKSLTGLYATLKKCRNRGIEPTNAGLHRAAFGKTHTAENDYLLKNELRLLNNIFYDFIVRNTFTRYSKMVPPVYNLWLARGLHSKGLYPEFARDINQFIEQAQKDITPSQAADLLEVKMLGIMQHSAVTAESCSEVDDLIQRAQNEVLRQFKYSKREWERAEACNHRFREDELLERYVPTENGYLSLEEVQRNEPVGDLYEEYLLLQKYAYTQRRNMLRVEVLKRMYEILEQNGFVNHTVFGEKLNVRNNLALELIYLDDYEGAEKYLLEAVAICDDKRRQVPVEIIQNCMMVHIFNGAWQKALDCYSKYEAEVPDCKYEVQLMLSRAYAFLFLKQPKKAFEALPELRGSEDEELAWRTAYVIMFYVDGNLEHAYNECLNLVRTVKGKTGISAERHELVIEWLRQYLFALQQNKTECRKLLSALHNELEVTGAQAVKNLKMNYALHWLLKEVGEKISTKKQHT